MMNKVVKCECPQCYLKEAKEALKFDLKDLIFFIYENYTREDIVKVIGELREERERLES